MYELLAGASQGNMFGIASVKRSTVLAKFLCVCVCMVRSTSSSAMTRSARDIASRPQTQLSPPSHRALLFQPRVF